MGKLQDELKTYNKTVLDHFDNPRNVGSLANPTLVVTADNPACQDLMKMGVLIKDGAVRDVRVKIMGCTVAIASASILSELIKGKRLEELRSISAQTLVEALGGLPDHKIRCTGAPLAALKKVIEQSKT
jgi:nitrogen fixation NifU-like protein